MTFITATSRIRQQRIFHNGKIIFQDGAPGLDDFLIKAYDKFAVHYPKYYKMDPLSKLGFIGAEVLLREMSIKKYPAGSVSLVLANAQASLDTDRRYHRASQAAPSPALFVYTLPNIVAGEICIRHGIKGENAFFVMPEFDAAWIAGYTDLVLAQESTQACIAGWVDVMDEHHDVFLYLAEKENRGISLEHTTENLTALYQQELWNS